MTVRIGLAAAALVGVASVSVKAGPVTFGSATTISGDSDVSTAGTLFQALGFAGSDETVNGVTFADSGLNGPSNGTPSTFGNLVITSSDASGIYVHEGIFGSGNPPFSNLSPSYQGLLAGAAAFQGGSVGTVQINNLLPNEKYQVQFFYNDSRSDNPSQVIAGGNSVTLLGDATPGNPDGGVGQFTTGTFTADSTGSESFTATPPDSGSEAQINAIQVRDLGSSVPEPASLGLLGVAGLGLLARRRRA